MNEAWVLGIGGSSHDFSAALMRGLDVKIAIESERLSRIKHGQVLWYEDPVRAAIEYCTEAVGIKRSDVAVAVTGDLIPYRVRSYCSDLPVMIYGHHLCHAASVYMMVPPDIKTAIIVYDGFGSTISTGQAAGMPVSRRETFSFYQASDAMMELLGTTLGEGFAEHTNFSNGSTNSIGYLYEMVTTLLGFHFMDTGKTMGLAAWGTPKLLDALHAYTTLGPAFDDCFQFDPFQGFEFDARRFLQSEGESFQARADLAASIQDLLTETLVHCYSLIEDLEFSALLLSGGCALNTVANGVLAQGLPAHRDLLIPPHASDAGQALGALWLYARSQEPGPFEMTFNGSPLAPSISRPGRSYSRSAVQSAANGVYPRVACVNTEMSAGLVAERIAAGDIVGVFNGASEFGPRALGGRSVLADPRDALVRERINRQIKQREPFRPLAPMILARHFDDYFWPAAARDHFMLTVAQANQRCAQRAPAVVHIDGGARVQVVDDDGDPFLVALLERFHELTGVPIVMNTSFNRRGEPIVETPAEAFEAFIAMGLDGLYAQGAYYVRT
jgi:carbamoyltransferase